MNALSFVVLRLISYALQHPAPVLQARETQLQAGKHTVSKAITSSKKHLIPSKLQQISQVLPT